MTIPRSIPAALSLLCLAVPQLTAQQASAADAAAADHSAKKFVLEAGDHRLRDLIHDSAKFLGRNYLVVEGEFVGSQDASISIQTELRLDAAGVEQVISQLAYSRGFAMVARDRENGVFEWVAVNGSRRAEIFANPLRLTPEAVLAMRNSKIAVSTVLEVEHIDAQRAVTSLRPFFSAASGMQALTIGAVSANAMLLTGYADAVAVAIEQVQISEQAAAKVEQNAERQGLAKRIEQLERRLRALEKKLSKD